MGLLPHILLPSVLEIQTALGKGNYFYCSISLEENTSSVCVKQIKHLKCVRVCVHSSNLSTQVEVTEQDRGLRASDHQDDKNEEEEAEHVVHLMRPGNKARTHTHTRLWPACCIWPTLLLHIPDCTNLYNSSSQ